MKESKITEVQTVKILKQNDACKQTKNISSSLFTYYSSQLYNTISVSNQT